MKQVSRFQVQRIITLTTDFGIRDGFVGMMKGVILSINPRAMIIDITHDIAPQNIEQGAFLFANAFKYFPPDAIHVVIVDPGVGSARRPIAAREGEMFFVAPDNGVLSLALGSSASVIHLDQPTYWLPRVSHTFHGRDIFAPIAAHLSLGVPLKSLGKPITDWVRLSQCTASWRAGKEIVGRVAHIDRFGNIITNISAGMLTGMDYARIIVTIRGRVLTGVKSMYAMVASGESLLLLSSSGHLEIAVRDGNAAQVLGVQFGDEVIAHGGESV